MNSKPTQSQVILNHLNQFRELDPLQALNLYGCFRLSARIHELKKDGWPIESKPWKTPGGATVSKYFMGEITIIA